MSIEAGNKVKTRYGDIGLVLRSAAASMVYDWWVEIKFFAKGRERTSVEPYRESELEKISEK